MDRGTWQAIVHRVAKESDTAELMEHTRTHAFKKLPHGQRRQRVRDGKEGLGRGNSPELLFVNPDPDWAWWIT